MIILLIVNSHRPKNRTNDEITVSTELIAGIERVVQVTKWLVPVLSTCVPVERFESEVESSFADAIESLILFRDAWD